MLDPSKRLREIMRAPVVTVAPQEAAHVAWSEMKKRGIHHLAVVQDGKLVGIIAASDLGGPRGGGSRRMGRRVADLMVRSVVTATPETSLRRAASLMRTRAVGCLPVVRDGAVKGIVTVSDMLAQIG